jgi:hypothetical protein
MFKKALARVVKGNEKKRVQLRDWGKSERD